MFVNFSFPYLVSIIFIFIFGACIGSFLNLVIYRMPINLSIIYPRSYCPHCEKTIPIHGLIPIAGFFFLLGQCYFCKVKIPWRYPAIEFFCAFFTTILYIHFINEDTFINIFFTNNNHFKNLVPFLTVLWLFYSGLTLSAIDIKYRILPDLITLPGTLIGFILSCFTPNIGWVESLKGIFVGFVGLYIITKLYEILRKKQGMGFGDVKYLGCIGAVVGALGVFYTLLFACIMGSIVGIIYGIYTKKGLELSIPFGPFLAISVFLVYIYRFY